MAILWQLLNMVISIIIYLIAPRKYVWGYCFYAMLSFFIAVIIYLYKKKIKNYFCFFTIFSITFFFVYYLYPVFVIIPSKQFFWFPYNVDVVTKATLLATVGYNFFAFGLLFRKRKNTIKQRRLIQGADNLKKTNYRKIEYTIPLICLMVCVGLTFIKFFVLGVNRYSNFEYAMSTGIWGYVELIKHSIIVGILTFMFYEYYKKGWKYVKLSLKEKTALGLIGLDMLIQIINGYRGSALANVIILLAGWLLIRDKFSSAKLTIVIAVGVVILNYIMLMRGGKEGDFSFDLVDITYDLIINNYTLYVEYDYVNNFGIVPITFWAGVMVVPFMKSIISSIFGLEYYSFSSADYISYYVQHGNVGVGLGTNIIGSIYLGCGMVGVIIFMFILGYFIEWLSEDIKGSSVYKLMLYFEMISVSVYLVRSEYFWPLKNIFFSMIVIWIFRHVRIHNKNSL